MASSFSTTRVSVGTSATLLWGGDAKSVELFNIGSASIDIGDSTVTSGTGRPLAAGSSLSVDLLQGSAGYGICASGTVSIAVTKVTLL